jgi:hypothetical protein
MSNDQMNCPPRMSDGGVSHNTLIGAAFPMRGGTARATHPVLQRVTYVSDQERREDYAG